MITILQVLFFIAVVLLLFKAAGKIISWAFQYDITWYLILLGALCAIFHYWGGQALIYACLALVVYYVLAKW